MIFKILKNTLGQQGSLSLVEMAMILSFIVMIFATGYLGYKSALNTSYQTEKKIYNSAEVLDL